MLQIVLLAGKFVLLIILYLFIYRVIRSSSKEFRMSAALASRRPEDRSLDSRGIEVRNVPGPSYAAAGVDVAGAVTWRLSVLKSRNLRPGEAFAFPPGASAMVGRAPEMDIQLDDTFVSSKHAVFQSTAGIFQVQDQGSTNGTLVNGVEIQGAHELRPGDRIEVGDTIFEVEVR